MVLTVTLNAAIDKRYVVSAFREGEVNRVRECVYTPGGKGLNVSKTAAIAGAEVVAAGFAGGHAGRYIIEELGKMQIKSAFYMLEAESRSCINIWDEEKKTQTEFLEPGFAVPRTDYEKFCGDFEVLVRGADVVVMSGSVPEGLGTNTYKELTGIVKDAGIPAVLDTSGELLEKGIEAKPTLIKPNLDEIRMLTGMKCRTKEELIDAAKYIYHEGVSIVVISLGSEGSVMICDSGVYQAVVPKISAVNTVGCGDTMIAGLAVGLEQKMSMEAALRYASSMSAAAAMREETGFFVRDDAAKLFKEIEIKRL